MARSIFVLLGIFLMTAVTVSAYRISVKMHFCGQSFVTPKSYQTSKESSISLMFSLLTNNTNASITQLINGSFFGRGCLAQAYKEKLGRDLTTDIREHFNGDLRDLMIDYVADEYDYWAKEMHDGLSGMNNNNFETVVDVVCFLTFNRDETKFLNAYKSRYNQDFNVDINDQRPITQNLNSKIPNELISRVKKSNSSHQKFANLDSLYARASLELMRDVCKNNIEGYIALRLYNALISYNYRELNYLILISAKRLDMSKVMKFFQQTYDISLMDTVTNFTFEKYYRQALLSIIHHACCVIDPDLITERLF